MNREQVGDIAYLLLAGWVIADRRHPDLFAMPWKRSSGPRDASWTP
ncbi:hypothetical protein ACQPXT_34215 [Streptomyces sp. CA-100214]